MDRIKARATKENLHDEQGWTRKERERERKTESGIRHLAFVKERVLSC